MKSAQTLAGLYKPSGWYNDATQSVHALANASSSTPERVATVIAALSPQVSVSRNVFAAIALLAGQGRVGGILGASWANAIAGSVQGPKTSAFRANLLGDYQPVTLDVWAWRALGFEIAPDIRHKQGSGLWREAFRRYRKAANMLGVSPAECQAGVWGSVRIGADRRFITNPTIGNEIARLAVDGRGSDSVQTLAHKALAWL